MILGFLLAFAGYSGGEEGGGGLLSVNPGLAIWTVITFGLLLIILRFVAWKPILKALDDREKEIADSLNLAKQAKDEAAKLIEENKGNMQKAEEESRKLIAEAQKFAEQLKEKAREDSKEQAAKIIADASAEIERKKQDVLNEIKNQVAEISVSIAEKVIRKNLSGQAQTEIVDEYIKEIQKN